MKPIFFKIDDDLYRTTIYVATNCTLSELAKTLKKSGIDTGEIKDEANAGGRYYELNSNDVSIHIIWIDKWDKSQEAFCNLVHEIMHLSFSIMENAGITVTYDNSEVFAYHASWVLDKCLTFFGKKKK